MKRYDFLVIGSGPAGQKAAIQAAKFGKRSAVIERRAVIGGVSVHTGTMPSKTLREAVLYLTGWNQRGLYGNAYRLKSKVTLNDLMQRLYITLKHEIEIMQDQMARNNVEVIQGIASFKDDHCLQVESAAGEISEVEADRILIATGTKPQRPEGIPFDDAAIIDSDGIVNLKTLPKTMIIVGAGVIGVEYASIFSVLDIELTLVDGRNTLLDFLDREIVDEFVHCMRQRGIRLRLGENVIGVEKDTNGRVITTLESGKRLRAELVMFAAGRVGTTAELQLEKTGLASDKKQRIPVNEKYQTVVPQIYAAGDVIGFPSLASTSMEQGRLAACHAFDQPSSSRPEHFPFGIYSVPEMSVVGATEQELTAKKIPYDTGAAHLWETARGQIMGLEEGMLKMIISTEDQRLLGVHILGEEATELIHIGQAVIVLGGSLQYFMETVFNYPTLAEAYKIAALDVWNRISDS
ncbi:Soluble pyridine nucleotide transhydrogenase (EC [Olavius algarvensis Delta 1 endosymbiont]|nr:Soluble pyridine nucleotide transhydrogenase (EC [Olavius algarvensis Delta 1 endosymbiont]